MQPEEILRIVDTIHRDKDIDKEIIFEGIETALLTAARKRVGPELDIEIEIDRDTGEIHSYVESGERLDPGELGRIAAQTAKQIIIQKIREAERDVVYLDYIKRKRDIVIGNVQRFEGPNVIVNLGKTEGILPKKEQVRGERCHIGDRIRAYVIDVKKVGHKVKIVLSRTHSSFIRRLFELEVPEISQGIIEINALVREAGYRTKIAVSSSDSRVDCVGACVGVRGSRIKNIIEELGGEKIDIIRWDDSSEEFIRNTLKPAEVLEVTLDNDEDKATVLVDDEQLSLAIGKKGQNVRLASKLSGWNIDIMTESQKKQRQHTELYLLSQLPHFDQIMAERFWYQGIRTYRQVERRAPEILPKFDGFDEGKIQEVLEYISNFDPTQPLPALPEIPTSSPEEADQEIAQENSTSETAEVPEPVAVSGSTETSESEIKPLESVTVPNPTDPSPSEGELPEAGSSA
ncbi:MAG: transcription termination factor NusA [Planctomycetota bacterium]|jgi:N utilization substance protein A|nr:transcription termination factor NusA [Planctomycetota bacterium]